MIIAVDFDGVLCKDEFPRIGVAYTEVVDAVKNAISYGHEVILWTSRVEQALDDAVTWCEEQGIHFCAINDAAPSNKAKYAHLYNTEPRKVYADYYIDDHALGYTKTWAVGILNRICDPSYYKEDTQ